MLVVHTDANFAFSDSDWESERGRRIEEEGLVRREATKRIESNAPCCRLPEKRAIFCSREKEERQLPSKRRKNRSLRVLTGVNYTPFRERGGERAGIQTAVSV